jgi:RNA polymerase sigma factor (sigma-70 family)
MDEAMDQGNQGEEFEHYRVLLFSIAYRMTGSASDAEDLVQETYLRYQASASQEIVSLKAYLTTIITRLALDYLKSARVAREQYIGAWLPEPILTSEDGGFPLADASATRSAFAGLFTPGLWLSARLSAPFFSCMKSLITLLAKSGQAGEASTSARVSSRSRSASFCSVFFPPVRPGTWRL